MPKQSSEYVRAAVMSFIDISIVGFLDEYDDHLGHILRKMGKNELLLSIKNIRSGVEKKWPELKTFRNVYLAHNFRIKNGKSAFKEKRFPYTFKVPILIKEKIEFSVMVGKIMFLLAQEFSEIFIEFVKNSFPRERSFSWENYFL
jgi:hypothetical protein